MHQVVGFGGVHNFAAVNVVLDRAFDQGRGIDELHQLGQRPANREGRECLYLCFGFVIAVAIGFAGVHPFAMVAVAGRKGLGRTGFDAQKFFLRDKLIHEVLCSTHSHS